MAWLHVIIMVGGGCGTVLDGLPDAAWALKKEEKKSEEPKVELANGGRSFVKGLPDQPGEPESDYLFRLRVLAVCRR